jgi:hypothetical protein
VGPSPDEPVWRVVIAIRDRGGRGRAVTGQMSPMNLALGEAGESARHSHRPGTRMAVFSSPPGSCADRPILNPFLSPGPVILRGARMPVEAIKDARD